MTKPKVLWLIISLLFVAAGSGCAGHSSSRHPVAEGQDRFHSEHSLEIRRLERIGWQALVELSDTPTAQKSFDGLLMLDATLSSAHFGRFLLAEAHGDFLGALQAARAVLRHEPLFPLRHFLLLRVLDLDLLGLPSAEIEAFLEEQSLLAPRDLGLRFLSSYALARLRLRRGDFAEASHILEAMGFIDGFECHGCRVESKYGANRLRGTPESLPVTLTRNVILPDSPKLWVRMGGDSGAQLELCGQLVLEHGEPDALFPDQFGVVIRAHRGRCQLRISLSQRGRKPSGFYIRIHDIDGLEVDLASSDGATQEGRIEVLTTASPPGLNQDDEEADAHALPFFTTLWARYQRASLERFYRISKARHRPWLSELRELRQLFPRFSDLATGLSESEADFNASWKAANQAMRLDPEAVSPILRTAEQLASKGLMERAQVRLEKARRLLPASPLVLVAEARLDLRRGRTTAALRLARSALEGTPTYAPALRLLLKNGLASYQSASEREALAQRALVSDATNPSYWEEFVSSVLWQGRSKAALDRLRNRRRILPWDSTQDREFLESLARIMPLEARQILERRLREKRATTSDLLLLRKLVLVENDFSAANRLLARLASENPENSDISGSYRFRNAATLESWQRLVSSLLQRRDGLDATGFDYIQLLNSKNLILTSNGHIQTRRHIILQALGRSKLTSHWNLEYSADEQRFELLRAERRSARGENLGFGQFEDRPSSLLDESAARIYNRNRQVRILFEEVRPGDLLDIEYRLEGTGLSSGRFLGDLFPLATGLPTVLGRYTLQVPRAFPIRIEALGSPTAQGKIQETAGSTTHVFTVKNIEGIRPEPGMPPIQERLPMVVVSTMSSFAEMAQWYLELAKLDHSAAKPNNAISKTAADLCATPRTDRGQDEKHLPSAREIASKIQDFLRDRVRYLGFEFGEYDFEPHTPLEVLSSRYGDCKDQSRLYIELARQCGIRAEMVLLRTRAAGKLQLKVPYLGIFNHALVYFPDLGEYADPTAAHHRFGELPGDLQGALALRVAPGSNLYDAPVSTAASNRFEITMKLQLSGTGEEIYADGRRQARYTGLFCPPIRASVATQGNPGIEPLRIPSATLEAGDIRYDDQPGEIHHSYRLRFPLQEGRLGVNLAPLGLVQRFAASSTRRQKLRLPHPFAYRTQIEIDLASVTAPPKLPAPVDLNFGIGTYRFQARAVGSKKIFIEEDLVFHETEIQASGYEEFRKNCALIDKLQGRVMFFSALPAKRGGLAP